MNKYLVALPVTDEQIKLPMYYLFYLFIIYLVLLELSTDLIV